MNYRRHIPWFAFLTIILSLSSFLLSAQGTWTYAAPTDGAGTTGAETGRSVCVDASGNIYCVGTFSGNGGATDFDLSSSTTNTFTAVGQDGYVASYTKAGVFRWKVIITGTGSEFGAPSGGICTDGTFVYFTGSTNVTGSPQIITPLATTNIISTGSNVDILVGKLNCSNGGLVWHVGFGSTATASENGQGICTDPSGSVYVTGGYNGTFTLNGINAPAPLGNNDFFIAKFTSTGVLKHFSTGGSSAGDMIGNGGGLCFVPGGTPAIVATGHIGAGTGSFGGFTNLTSSGGLDAFLVELDTALAFTNALVFGGSGSDELLSATYDPYSKAVFTSGYYAGSAVTLPGTAALQNPGGNDLIVARYSVANNNFTWARSAVGSGATIGNERALSIVADGNGGILVGGFYASSNVDFGSSVTPGGNMGLNDAFVARYNVNGTPLWALRAGSTGTEEVRGIASYVETSPSYVQTIFATGLYGANTIIGATSLTNDAGNDFFVARVNDATPRPTPLPIELIAFNAINRQSYNNINWKTAAELNIDHFEVEKSLDGVLFEPMGIVKAMGNGSNYSVNDLDPASGKNWYRLKITGIDELHYSNTALCIFEADLKNSIYVHPNPADDFLHVRIPSASIHASVSLTDITGRVVNSALLINEQADINTAGLSPGIYTLHYIDSAQSQVIKIFKK